MDPFSDVNSYQGASASLAGTKLGAYVRPLDIKGQLGAGPVQRWKEGLREDFATDDDNFSTNAHDAMLDKLRRLMQATTSEID